MARKKKVELPKAELNITAMMDLVLNLLTFFVLVSNFAMAELPPMETPDPIKSAARAEQVANKVVVNLIPDGNGGVRWLKVGSIENLIPTDIPAFTAALAREKGIDKDVQIDFRADRNIRYEFVAPVMKVIKESGVSRINVVAQLSD